MKENVKLKGQLKRFLQWPLLLTILLLFLNAAVYVTDVKSGVLVSAGIFVYILFVFFIVRNYRPKIMNELISFASQYNSVEKQLVDAMALPYALMDKDGKLIWGNKEFAKLTGKEQYFDKNIAVLFPELGKEAYPGSNGFSQVTIHYEERIFRVSMQKILMNELMEKSELFQVDRVLGEPEAEMYVIALYFFDSTELEEAMRKNEEDKLVTALAYLDNYEEALESVEEVRRSLLIALIDRKITKHFSNYDGMVKKLEKDKYLIIMRKTFLDKMQEKKFPILEEVKTVNIGNAMNVTLSIGVGVNASTFLQNYEYCRIAMEMALGRGGDQAVVKNGENISYYGGKSQTIEKNTRVKARVKAQALKEFISTREKVVIMGHKITDVDAFGAAVGIYRASKTLGKPAHIVINDPTTSIKPLVNVFMENSEYEADMFVSSSEAKEMVDNNTVVVVVDTNKPSYTECEELLYRTRTIVVLDHHRRGSEIIQNAVLSYVEPYASSTCEMVAEILQYFADGLRIRNIEADSMYAGIIIDTNNFTARAGVRTFEAAAFLRRNGADVTRVRKMLRDNFDSYKARAEAIRSAEIYKGCYAIGICPSEGLESPTVVGAQAANELLDIDGVKGSFVLTEYHGVVYISARSIDEVNVQVLMEKLGGGGHMNVAGAQIKASVEETRQMLKEIIDELDQKGEEK
ncbi:MAG: DHH family phosphoesterase [Eubacteriales bacterium]|nr:DHH family phosphoesterase [Eubacteriales bacterium]